MGWSIFVNWDGASENQQGQHPGFANDDHSWAEWVCAVCNDPTAMQLIEELELIPLLAGAGDAQTAEWVSDIIDAATNLRILVSAHDPTVEPLVDLYKPQSPNPEAPHDCFVQDLEDVELIAKYAKDQGARQMVFDYEC